MVGRFLAGVGAIVWDPGTDRYLLLRRAATKDYASGSWECVTGRVDQGESFEQALHREVREELGIAVQVEYVVGTTHFYRGEATPENELLGVVYCCTQQDKAPLVTSAEHDTHRWVTLEEALVLLDDAKPGEAWLRGVLQRVAFTRFRLDPELRAFHRYMGLDTNQEA